MTLKIAIVVHGRFHAFDLARALLERGHNVTLFTNYPKWAVEKFGISKTAVQSFWLHGLVTRLVWKIPGRRIYNYSESWFHRLFGKWASKQLQKDRWDVIHCWSGVAEESLVGRINTSKLHLMVRGSAHIRVQARLLYEEETRTKIPQEQPSSWIIDREEREYVLADKVVVLSTFAYNTFISQGVSPKKLSLMPLGARLDVFRPTSEVIERRYQRILSGEPLRILFVGALSFRKGLWDLATIVKELDGKDFQFRFVGPSTPDTARLVSQMQANATFIPKQPQSDLPNSYAWGDIFIFPTIEDGFAVVLAQAFAAGLLILTTPNCAGPDIVSEGKTGWILPIRNPESFVARLRWCASHRSELSEMVRSIPAMFQPREWKSVAADFENICYDGLAQYAELRETT
jgi:glycosyltransferase involved in cell wall biosynthesis